MLSGISEKQKKLVVGMENLFKPWEQVNPFNRSMHNLGLTVLFIFVPSSETMRLMKIQSPVIWTTTPRLPPIENKRKEKPMNILLMQEKLE